MNLDITNATRFKDELQLEFLHADTFEGNLRVHLTGDEHMAIARVLPKMQERLPRLFETVGAHTIKDALQYAMLNRYAEIKLVLASVKLEIFEVENRNCLRVTIDEELPAQYFRLTTDR